MIAAIYLRTRLDFTLWAVLAKFSTKLHCASVRYMVPEIGTLPHSRQYRALLREKSGCVRSKSEIPTNSKAASILSENRKSTMTFAAFNRVFIPCIKHSPFLPGIQRRNDSSAFPADARFCAFDIMYDTRPPQ
jgi:hypothetical protein